MSAIHPFPFGDVFSKMAHPIAPLPTVRGPPLAACPFAEVNGSATVYVCVCVYDRLETSKKKITSLHDTFDSCWWQSTLLAGFGLHFAYQRSSSGHFVRQWSFHWALIPWGTMAITSTIYHPRWNQKIPVFSIRNAFVYHIKCNWNCTRQPSWWSWKDCLPQTFGGCGFDGFKLDRGCGA